jgi:hypothetical protein
MSFARELFNNREIATIIWLLIFFTWALSKNTVRSSFYNVLKALFEKKVFLSVFCMLLYVFLMVLSFKSIGFWDTSAIKDTVLWTLGVAFIMLVNSNKVSDDEHYFRRTISDNVKLILVLEFVINLYTFSLVAELVLVPIITFVVMLKAVAELKPEHKQVETILDYALGLFGIGLIILTFHNATVDFQSFATLKNLRDLLLPPAFTVAFLPFIYLVALFMKYESVFIRIDFFNDNSELASYAKRKILAACHFNLRNLNKFSKKVGMLRINSRDDVLAFIQKAKSDSI